MDELKQYTGRYLYLSPGFKITFWPEVGTELYDFSHDRHFRISKEQCEILKLLTGRFTLEKVFTFIDDDSKDLTCQYLQNLASIGALSSSRAPKERFAFPPEPDKPILHTVHYEVTGRCNMACSHCYMAQYASEDMVSSELHVSEIKRLIDDLASMNVDEMLISGGEALLRDDLFEIIDYAVLKRIRVSSLFSNGLLLDDNTADYLKNCGSLVHVFISLDGQDSSTNARLRCAADESVKNDSVDLFSHTVSAIKRLVSKEVSIRINTVVHDGNLPELMKMYHLLKELKVPRWRIAFPRKIGTYTETHSEHSIDFEEFYRIAQSLIDLYLDDYCRDGEEAMNIEIENIFRTDMLQKGVYTYEPSSFMCGYQAGCAIKPNGDVTSCAFLNSHIVGNIRQKPIRDIWYSVEMQKRITRPVADVDECKQCQYSYLCGGGCRASAFAETGSIDRKDPLACKLVPFFAETILPLVRSKGLEVNLVEESAAAYANI